MTRAEIRDLVRSHAGLTTNGAQSGQTKLMIDAFIGTAYLKVFAECKWAAASRRFTADLLQGQSILNLPPGCSPGSLRAIAYALASQQDSNYVLVKKMPIPVQADQDQQEAAGGSILQAAEGFPQYWEERNKQLVVWPISNDAYKIRMDYTAQSEFLDDITDSTVDAQLIMFWATRMYMIRIGDGTAANDYAMQYKERRDALVAGANDSQRFIPTDNTASFADTFDGGIIVPQWNNLPTVR